MEGSTWNVMLQPCKLFPLVTAQKESIQIKDKKIISQFVVFTSCKLYCVSLGYLLSGSVKRRGGVVSSAVFKTFYFNMCLLRSAFSAKMSVVDGGLSEKLDNLLYPKENISLWKCT